MTPHNIQSLRELRILPHWILWRLETVKGRPTKVPYQPHHPTRKAATNDQAHWATYDDAALALVTHGFNGLGFVLTGTDFVAFDLDDCRDPETGALDDWAQELARIIHESPWHRNGHGSSAGLTA
ncbi:hypothetical protein [Magnetospira sp. QH-2]|uniref:hypothetical protein n=1 Tax=Magnetospira sp. (strain QH-2) TaxID=1288970 RepID=UPI0003E81549|nr:hypothetical protein [Magnetospira sp. QH-2]CCQ72418.1 protein of unknown function [Magnetospira sp. QH-2]